VRRWNPEQQDAVARRGHVFVSAGAGTGKTAVLVERVVQRVLDGTPLDRVLVITFTDRAAAELKRRVRERLEVSGELERSRAVDGAWISTIHRFCLRLLRVHALRAGLDPRFSVADETQTRILASEAFDLALERFVAGDDERRIDLLAGYGRVRLREMLLEVYGRLRSAGRPIELVAFARADLEAAIVAARSAALEVGEREEAATLIALLDARPSARDLADLSDHRIRNTAPYKAYNEARTALEAAARDALADADRVLLGELLAELHRAYAGLKDARSLLDFEDLELRARELLAAEPAIAESYRERFVEVMVDEFQDTNRLQCELVDLVAGNDLFLVGDEFQSIYRFRHADVSVYRSRRRAAGDAAISLVRNHRSRAHVLDAVNELYEREFGERYTPLVPEGEFTGDPPGGDRVELLLTDKDACAAAGVSWRDVEARQLAARIAELVSSGACVPGQVVLLFEAGTDAARYEDALRAHRLPTIRTTGRGYYDQIEVADLLSYLRLVRNRYDDMAFLAVLASPLVGVSNDSLFLIRQAAPKRPVFTAFERDELPAELSALDVRLSQAFVQRFNRLAARAGSIGLARLVELIVSEHDYDLACLAQADGDRRYANVRKLVRLAGEFEATRGPDLEAFIGFCEEQRDLAAREGEAALAEEGGDAIVLMTIHAAKGLEFDVVAVADTGRETGLRRAADILCTPDGRVAFRAPDPATGAMTPALGYDEVRRVEAAAEAEEGRRLHYVAMTRAREHLIVSGAVRQGESTAVARLCELLGVDVAEPAEGELDAGRGRFAVRLSDPAEPLEIAAAGEPAADIGSQLELDLFGAAGRVVAPLPELSPPPLPAPVSVRGLSYSALALHARCPYRFLAERVLRLPEGPELPVAAAPVEGLSALELGDLVHVALERGDVDVAARYPHAAPADREALARFVAAWEDSPLRARLDAAAAVRREWPFSFSVAGVLFHGRFDVHATVADGATLVVDYKTNRLGEDEPAAIVERTYRAQVTTYALAALLAEPRPERVEVAYAFLERPDAIVMQTFVQDDVPALRAELERAVEEVRGGPFPARPGEHCSGCPALTRLCAGPALAAVA
jgi:ATP-dependent helicase/nuclease subunit A